MTARSGSAAHDIAVIVNGTERRARVIPRMLLADVLREEWGLTGTHLGCEHGACGACTVLVDGEPTRSCLVFAVQADGCRVDTVEGLAGDGPGLHPLQEAFRARHALQCGFCTPGILMTLVAYLRRHSGAVGDGGPGSALRQPLPVHGLSAHRAGRAGRGGGRASGGHVGVKFVGDRHLRKEDPRLLTGRGRYVADIALPGMLHAVLLRSPHAHARIVGSTRRAPSRTPGWSTSCASPISEPRGVSFPWSRRTPSCAGTTSPRSRATAPATWASRWPRWWRTAATRRRTPASCWRSSTSRCRRPRRSRRARPPSTTTSPTTWPGASPSPAATSRPRCGAAPRVASLRLRIGRGGGQPMETRGLVADWNAALGQLTVWASSQVPHQIRQFIADLLDLAPHQVRVIAPDVGGGFGAKLIVYPEDVLIPFLARRLARPVRWIEDRLEHMLAATQEREQEHEVTVGFDDTGRLLALRDRFVHDTGAYTPRGLVVPLLTASMLTGPYRIAAVESSFESRYTHRVPVTPYRGAGQPQAVFVIERVLDLVARETGRDRAQVRLANLVRAEDMPWDTGLPNYRGSGHVVLDSGDLPSVLRRALESARYDALAAEAAAARAQGRLVGVGVACYVELTGVGPFESARVRVDPAGRITAFSGVTTQGQGLETTLAQVAADELGVTPEDVTVIAGDTAGVEHGTGSFASRAAVVGGSAVALAARDVSAKARLLAAKALGCAEAELEQAGAAFADRRRPERRVTFAELARLAGAATAALGVEPGLESTRFFQPTDMTYSSGAHVALVELDALSACVRILGYWISHDSGRLINPLVVEGQLQGAVALGIGSALLEEITLRRVGPAPRGQLHGLSAAHRDRRAEHGHRPPRDALAPEPARSQGRGRVRCAPRPRRPRLGDRGRGRARGRSRHAHAPRARAPAGPAAAGSPAA